LDLKLLGFVHAQITGRPPYNPADLLKLYIYVSISNLIAKIIATENTEITEDFFSVSSVLSVADKCKQ
jgi:hypothetical protein